MQQTCCPTADACLSSPECSGTLNCIDNCYNTLDGGAADVCANNCGGMSAPLFVAFENCFSTCAGPCMCP
jgi:hypothetical protein